MKEAYKPSPEEKAISKKEVLREFFSVASTQKRLFIYLTFVIIIQGAVTGGGIWLVKATIDQFFANRGQKDVLLLIGALFIITVLKSLSDFLFNYVHGLAVIRIRYMMVVKAFRNFLNTPFSFHMQNRSSKKYGWMLKDTINFIESFVGMFRAWIKQPVTLFSTITAMAVINWKLTLMGGLIFPAILPFIIFLRRRTKELIAEYKMQLGVTEEIVSESIHSIRVVKAFGLEEKKIGRLSDAVNKQQDITRKNALFTGLMSPVTELLGFSGLTIILIAGSHSSFFTAFSPGTFFAFLMAFLNIYRPLKDIAAGFIMYKMAVDSGRRLIILQKQAEMENRKTGAEAIEHFYNLRLENICFSYSNEMQEKKSVLENISMNIRRGEIVALIGKTGVGKSTLCDLIFRLLAPQKGGIFVNEIPIDSIEKESYRRIFSMCSQDTIVFNDTILENIRIAKPDASREEVSSIIEAVQLSSYVDSLPDGMDTPIGDRGIHCSQGERQRIAIGRALLMKPEFLVLDEAMNGIDVETEESIWKNIRKLLPDITILVVSHRWQTISYCDRVIVISSGKIAADRQVKGIDNGPRFLFDYQSVRES